MTEAVFSTQGSLFPCLLSEELENYIGFRVDTLYMFTLYFLIYIQGCRDFFLNHLHFICVCPFVYVNDSRTQETMESTVHLHTLASPHITTHKCLRRAITPPPMHMSIETS